MKNKNDYLANGFTTVDESKDQIVYTNCLNYIDAIPYSNEVKIKTYESLKLEEAKEIFEIGYGIV